MPSRFESAAVGAVIGLCIGALGIGIGIGATGPEEPIELDRREWTCTARIGYTDNRPGECHQYNRGPYFKGATDADPS